MGGSVSKSTSKSSVDLVQKSVQNCPQVGAENVVNLNNSTITCPVECIETGQGCSMEISQSTLVDATCLISTHQEALATLISEMDTKSKAAMGYSDAQTKSDISRSITNKVEANCGAILSTNKINAENIRANTCKNVFVQGATAKSECALNTLMGLTDDVTATQKTSSEGFNPLKFLEENGMFFAIAIGLIVILFIIKALLK